ncbi:MAG: arsenate reductase family protein [Clostridiales bacterium]|jgi:arsenate reductase|nr:arsenate reductase family protein [Clostridiales bacterium]
MTCKRAMDWLNKQGIDYQYRDIKKENPTFEELKRWYGRSGLPLKRFWNTSGIPYRKLGLKNRLPDMSDEEQLRLLGTNGMLVKRPLVVGTDFVLTGFQEAEWNEQFK